MDIDGIQFCDKNVIDFNAWSVYKDAINQARESLWTSPTQDQKDNSDLLIDLISKLLNNYKTYGQLTIENVDSFKAISSQILITADKLNLQCVRAKIPTDSYLLFYTKPGIKNYNGSFMMIREFNYSDIIIISPHDGTDQTHSDTKLAFKNSKAFCCFSNGHHKWSREQDFSHTVNTLGYYTLVKLCTLIQNPILLNIHGMAVRNMIMKKSNNPELVKVFNDIVIPKYVPKTVTLSAYFVIDDIKTDYNLKCEIPTSIHINRPQIVEDIVHGIEIYLNKL